jgi:hypothetical protein
MYSIGDCVTTSACTCIGKITMNTSTSEDAPQGGCAIQVPLSCGVPEHPYDAERPMHAPPGQCFDEAYPEPEVCITNDKDHVCILQIPLCDEDLEIALSHGVCWSAVDQDHIVATG